MKLLLDGKPTFGLFVTSAEDRYENAILRGVFDVVKAVGGSLVCFTSGALRSYHGFESKRNILYDLVTPDTLDGLVISGALGHNIGVSEMESLCARYAPLPIVSIALPMQGIPGLRVDSLGGMRRVVDHLLEVHGKRRIAFIRGPLGQQEAEERYLAYRQALAAHGVPELPGLVVNGDYTFHSGERAMDRLLTDSPGEFDAVVSANDSMALGAMEVARARGMRVPQDVAITGFDDTDDGRYYLPPLTTVRQSPYEQGAQAARLLLDGFAGQAPPLQSLASAALVVRQSCGCGLGRDVSLWLAQDAAPTRGGQHLTQTRERIRAAIIEQSDLFSASMPAGWLDLLVDALQADLSGQSQGVFLSTLQNLLMVEAIAGNEMVWHRILDLLQSMGAPAVGNPLPEPEREAMWMQARLLVNEVNARQQAQRRIWSEKQTTALRELGETMLTTFNMDSLLDVIAHELPVVGVQSCCLSVYENPMEPAGGARLIMAFDMKGRRDVPAGGVSFDSRALVPAEIGFTPGPGCLLVEALYSKSDQLGFVIMEMPPELTTLSGTLRGLLSSALQGILLLQQRQKVEAELRMYQTTLEQMVASRTDAMVETNLKLRLEIEERQRAEKTIRQLNADLEARVAERTAQLETANKELEAFSYSVSHDLRAPLRSVAGFSRIILEDFSQDIPEEARGYLKRIQDGAQQMGNLIDDLLAFSRLGRHEMRKRSVDVHALVSDVCQDLAHEYAGRQVRIILGVLPPAHADPSLLTRVYANLIGNAIKYTRQRAQSEIEVGCSKVDGKNVYFVRDNGAGFNMKYANKLFGVFQRLHRQDEFEGTGVGLAIVKRIVDRHGGRIWAEAEEDRGAAFFFTLSPD